MYMLTYLFEVLVVKLGDYLSFFLAVNSLRTSVLAAGKYIPLIMYMYAYPQKKNMYMYAVDVSMQK
jgi:hypothetical protein